MNIEANQNDPYILTYNSQASNLYVETIGKEVVQHLHALLGADVQIILDIEADVPDGVPDQVVSIVSENAKTLKLDNFGFEEE